MKILFLHHLGLSEETLWHKRWKFLFKKGAVDLILSSRAVRTFYFTFFQSQQNSLKLGNQQNSDFFDFLRSVLAIFQPKTANISLRAD